jgi:histidyl-tRNA synthetase
MLVRGLDYYSKTVFEWTTEQLGAQGTVCAGGRYDGLVEQLGGRYTPAVGFALGMERLVALLGTEQLRRSAVRPHAYWVLAGDQASRMGIPLSESLRDILPSLRMIVNSGGGGFKSQMKRADKSEADLAIIIGDDECANNTVTIKHLREEREQEIINQADLANWLENYLQ